MLGPKLRSIAVAATLFTAAQPFASLPAVPAPLTIGIASEATSLDPQFYTYYPNLNLSHHIFEPLVRQDDRQRLVPALADSWRAVDETTWEFTLRANVTFHNGDPLTAEDVAATLRRVPRVPNSPSSFAQYTRNIVRVEVTGPLTIRLHTATPYPLLPNDLSLVFIISKAFESATTADFNDGRAAIGTGPFRFVRWAQGDRVVLARNDAYWGDKPAWEQVTFRLLTNPAARVAALRAGDVDAIEAVPPTELERIRSTPTLRLSSIGANRIIQLQLDSGRARSPFIVGPNGEPLDRNPLQDVRVRQAISMAVNRQAIVERVMEGQGIASSQIVPPGFIGHDPSIAVTPFDPEAARALLREAGYPEGFGLTLHGPNNRYPNDERVAQAVGAMLSRIGLQVRVETLPAAVYFSRFGRQEFSVAINGSSAGTGEAGGSLRAHVASFNAERRTGASNNGRYSNPEVDAILTRAFATIDDRAREQLLFEASRLAMREVAFVPLYFQINNWAMRRQIDYIPRTDEFTWAMSFRPAAE